MKFSDSILYLQIVKWHVAMKTSEKENGKFMCIVGVGKSYMGERTRVASRWVSSTT